MNFNNSIVGSFSISDKKEPLIAGEDFIGEDIATIEAKVCEWCQGDGSILKPVNNDWFGVNASYVSEPCPDCFEDWKAETVNVPVNENYVIWKMDKEDLSMTFFRQVYNKPHTWVKDISRATRFLDYAGAETFAHDKVSSFKRMSVCNGVAKADTFKTGVKS